MNCFLSSLVSCLETSLLFNALVNYIRNSNFKICIITTCTVLIIFMHIQQYGLFRDSVLSLFLLGTRTVLIYLNSGRNCLQFLKIEVVISTSHARNCRVNYYSWMKKISEYSIQCHCHRESFAFGICRIHAIIDAVLFVDFIIITHSDHRWTSKNLNGRQNAFLCKYITIRATNSPTFYSNFGYEEGKSLWWNNTLIIWILFICDSPICWMNRN